MGQSRGSSRRGAVKAKPPRRQGRAFTVVVKTFVWIVLAVFIVTSVGVALVVSVR
jgi:hypothetical protein